MIKKILPVVLLVVFLAAPLPVFAKDVMPGRWWNNQKVAKLINLTETEKYKLEDKFVESRRKRIKLKAEVEQQQFEMEVLLDRGADEKEIMVQYKKVEAARCALGEEIFRFLLDTRNIIGSDRFNQLKDAAKQFKRARKSGRESLRQRAGSQEFGQRPGFGGQEGPNMEFEETR